MGARVDRRDGAWEVDGLGTGGLLQPRRALDMGNSGTSTRLLMGLIASHPVTATFVGDESLCRRPMDRVIAPPALLGAAIVAGPGGRRPIKLRAEDRSGGGDFKPAAVGRAEGGDRGCLCGQIVGVLRS